MTEFRICIGADYVYLGTWPAGRRGHTYRVESFAIAVPAYQSVVIVVGLTGPDAGRRFVCTPSNFADRYDPLPDAPTPTPEPAPELPKKAFGYIPESWRTCT